MEDGRAVRGRLRISPKNYQQCFVKSPAGLSPNDVAVEGMESRNRALEGDTVVVELLPPDQWQILERDAERAGVALPKARAEGLDSLPPIYIRPTGRVVSVSPRTAPLLVVGSCTLPSPYGDAGVLFVPRDTRVPRVLLPHSADLADIEPQELILVRVESWPCHSNLARGAIERRLGHAGHIEGETKGILLANGVDTSEFPPEALEGLPATGGAHFDIPASEVAKRRDFRRTRIFSIDPPTARDLDDALSCTPLDDGTFEVGVHIADVTYFMRQDTPLDEIAARRATTTYLVQEVHPMLPRVLCENLCSLNPSVDRLAFSVVWRLDAEAHIVGEPWFGRSVIRSCAKLAYGHAQSVIDGEVDAATGANWPEDWPEVTGDHTRSSVCGDIMQLHTLAQHLRTRRFSGGALRLNKPKFGFLYGDDGMPCETIQYTQRPANQLVEEFMLLANMAVARRIYSTYPDGGAMLRLHPAPLAKKLDELIEALEPAGVHLRGESSGHLQRSIQEYATRAPPEHVAALQVMLTAPMQVAAYVSAGAAALTDDTVADGHGGGGGAAALGADGDYSHFALNVPLYTHFTSPIRRFADVVVHRQLQAALNGAPSPYHARAVAEQALVCNARKAAAKEAQEASAHLYLWVLIGQRGGLREDATVVKVQDRSFDFVCTRLGIEDRCNLEREAALTGFRHDAAAGAVQLNYANGAPSQTVHLFSHVTVELRAEVGPQNRLAIRARLCPPDVASG